MLNVVGPSAAQNKFPLLEVMVAESPDDSPTVTLLEYESDVQVP